MVSAKEENSVCTAVAPIGVMPCVLASAGAPGSIIALVQWRPLPGAPSLA
jgi:hypothetical protein